MVVSAAAEQVKLFGMWASPNVRRVEWALQMKGVSYEYVEEELSNKSASLLHFNPVNQQVPVLVHAGRAVTESLVILEYIDEVWKSRPLLPRDPHERATARFWAAFAEEKCREATRKAFFGVGQERSRGIELLKECLQNLDDKLRIRGKKFFGGEEIGFTDLVVGWLAFWLGVSEKAAGFKAADPEKMPWFAAWADNFLQVPVIRENLPPRDRAVEFFRSFRELQLADASSKN